MPALRAPAGQVAAALLTVYVIWGSTYLAIRFAIETLPVFSYAGLRFLIAGAVLYAVVRVQGGERPSRAHWRDAAVVGGLLLLGGNGLVSIAELTVPSGLAAVIIATVPLWMVLLHWWPGGVRPSFAVVVATLVGLGGVALLVGPAELAGTGRVDPLGAGLLVLASLSWAAGSLYSRRAAVPSRPLLATGMQQLAGGVLLLVAGGLAGEFGALRPETFSGRSLLALAYLVVFGSLVAFTAYIWLLRHAPPALVSTYAFVNPVVAVFLGWWLAAEPITPRTVLASAVVVGAVAIITMEQARNAIRDRRERDEPEGSVGE